MVFENMTLRRIFGLMRKYEKDGETCILWVFVICTCYQVILG
jgi:hypothetical protein